MSVGRFHDPQGPQSSGGPKKYAAGLGRRRGGFSSTLHAVVDALGNCPHRGLTGGRQADCPQVPVLLAARARAPKAGVADKACDADQVRASIAHYEAEAVIPPQANRLDQRAHDENRYADRNQVERFFGRLKEARGFATRYDKTATSFLAVAHLLAALDWMRSLSTRSRCIVPG